VSDGHRATAPLAPELGPQASPGALDAEILDAFTRGERRRALACCAREHGASIGRLCMAMLGSQVDADDMTQETLLSAHQSLLSYREEGSVRAWLLGIARHKCLQHLEKNRRRGARLRLVTTFDASPAADEVLAAKKRAEQARALLEQVRPTDREALLLRFGADLSFREVAMLCGIDEPTARKRVSRALSRLRGVLAKEDDDE
jgi:RNA polymerase sigma-70 factor, ECF subfamily